MLVEAAAVLVLLLLATGMQVRLAGASYLFRRLFWLDEIVTHTLVNTLGTRHMLRALVGGLDSNPPLYHLLLRAIRVAGVRADETCLRGVAFGSALVGLVGLYVNLRQVISPLPAFTAVLAVWAHPLLLKYAFEGRMYASWFAAAVWFCYFLTQSCGPEATLASRAGLALCAVLTCGLHTLGGVVIVLVLSIHLLARISGPWDGTALALAALGPAVSLAWLPFLRRQNAAFATTWMSKPDRHFCLAFLRLLLPPPRLLAAVVVCAGLSANLPAPWGAAAGPAAPLAGLTGLFFLPLVLLTISTFSHPVVEPRYALPAVAGWAPVLAALLAHAGPLWLLLLCGILFWTGVSQVRTLFVACYEEDVRIDGLLQALRTHTGAAPVLFEAPLDLYLVRRYAPDIAWRFHGLDFEADQIGGVDAVRLCFRDMMRLMTRYYPGARLLPWGEVCAQSQHYLVPSARTLGQGFSGPTARYPGFTALQVEGRLYRLTAVNGLAKSA